MKVSIADPCSISLQLINTNLVNLELIIAQEQAGHETAKEVWCYVVVGLVVHQMRVKCHVPIA